MLVECISNKVKDVPKELLANFPNEDTFSTLAPGDRYVVYAMTLSEEGHVWYYICDRDNRCPYWFPCSLFRILDGRLSKYWVFNHFVQDLPYGSTVRDVWAFPEWACDAMFYERLLDGLPAEVAVFEKYKRLIDNE